MKITFVGNFKTPTSSESQYAETLTRMGHEVTKLQEGVARGHDILRIAGAQDLLVWIHTHGWRTRGYIKPAQIFAELKSLKVPTITYHLDIWLGIARQRDLDTDPFYKSIDHFFTVDKLMADWFNANTKVKGHYIGAGVYDKEAVMLPPNSSEELANEVIFVGSKGYHTEWKYRPILIDWLSFQYKDRFTHIGGDGRGVARGLKLNQVYANSKIAVGDTLCINFDYPHYLSDRVFETTGRGGFIIHPYIKGIEDYFEVGKEIVTYPFGDFKELDRLINYYLEHDDEREAIRKRGFERTKAEHTYRHRWEQIFKELGL